MAALDFTDVDALVTLLKAAELRSVEVDPAKLIPPGVLVLTRGISLDSLDGVTIQLDLLLIVPDQDIPRAQTALADLFNKVVPVLARLGGPTADTTAGRYTLPGSSTPLPTLVVPHDLLTTEE